MTLIRFSKSSGINMSGLKVLANILRALVAILLKSDIEQFSIIDSNLMGV